MSLITPSSSPYSVLVPNAGVVATPFSRASTATYIGSDGLLKTAQADQVRLPYDPLTGAPLAPLSEPAGTNLALQSETLDASVWTTYSVDTSVTANAAVAPDGAMTADLIVNTSGGSATSRRTQLFAVPTSTTDRYVCSAHFKSAGAAWCELDYVQADSATGIVYQNIIRFDYQTRSVIYSTSGVTCGFVELAGGWFRLWIVSQRDLAGQVVNHLIRLWPSGHHATNFGNSYIWGTADISGFVLTSYIPTVAAAVTRAADVQGFWSNAPEPGIGETPWNAATNYTTGTLVTRGTTHRIYSNLIAGVDAALPEASPLRWKDFAPTNKYAAWDDQVATATSLATELDQVFYPGACNSIALLGLQGSILSVTVRDGPGGNVLTTWYGLLEESAPLDWYDYFFSPPKQMTQVVITGIEPFLNCEVTVRLTGPTAKCGMVIAGDMRNLGLPQYGAKASPQNNSYIGLNADGSANLIVKRSAAKNLSVQAELDTSEANAVARTINELLAVPCLWLITNLPDYAYLSSFGLGSADVTALNYATAQLNSDVKGLI